jgi:hypothetical protein
LRFWAEVVMAMVCAVTLLLTLVWGEWIEVVFRVDPDHGSGMLEWLIVVSSAIATVLLLVGAGTEWRRAGARAGLGLSAARPRGV